MDILVSKEIIENIPILIVDVEQQYLEDDDVYGLISEEYYNEVKEELKGRMDTIYQSLKSLNSHLLYATHDKPLYPKLEALPIKNVHYWLNFKDKCRNKIISHTEYEQMVDKNLTECILFEPEIHHEFYQALKNVGKILVCGLWKDRCVFNVTKLLRENGIDAILLDNDNYTIGSEVIGDGYPLEDVADFMKLNLKYVS